MDFLFVCLQKDPDPGTKIPERFLVKHEMSSLSSDDGESSAFYSC